MHPADEFSSWRHFRVVLDGGLTIGHVVEVRCDANEQAETLVISAGWLIWRLRLDVPVSWVAEVDSKARTIVVHGPPSDFDLIDVLGRRLRERLGGRLRSRSRS